jgi:hypothetical protein
LSAISKFPNENLDTPEIRVSHPIGRTPDALHIAAKDLQSIKELHILRWHLL